MKNNIKVLRAIANMTQADLADNVWVRRETILFLEKWDYNPSLELAFKISNFFGKSIEDIFNYDG